MNRKIIAFALLTLALFVAACNAPDLPPPTSAPVVQPTKSGGLPLGACQSRLFGKITNGATKQSPANTSIEIAAGSVKFKTITDANGLYGFAGLCAGNYTITITPPGGKPLVGSNPIPLDGIQPVKQDVTY